MSLDGIANRRIHEDAESDREPECHGDAGDEALAAQPGAAVVSDAADVNGDQKAKGKICDGKSEPDDESDRQGGATGDGQFSPDAISEIKTEAGDEKGEDEAESG